MRQKLGLPGILLALSIVIVVVGFKALFPAPEKQQDLALLLPKSVGAWQRVKLISGTAALEKINHLHGKNITVEAGVIGNYQAKGKDPAMVWISRSKTPALTREQAEVMADKMVSNPRSPFHDPETLNINKTKVYKFMGMGQVHYIFCRERLAYWISSPPADGEKLLLFFL